MENSKKVLKNDQNNHLNDQIEHFEKIVPLTKRNKKPALKASVYETTGSDEITPIYVRGYN